MKTRIAFVIDTIDSPTSGTEQQLIRLIDELDRKHFEPTLCCLRSSGWLLHEWRGCSVHCADITSFNRPLGWAGIIRLARWFRKNRIQVVQTHFRDGSIAGILAAWLARVPVIIGTRRGRPLYSGLPGKLLFRLLNILPTTFLANSRFSRDLAIKEEGIDPKRFVIVHDALDLSVFPAPSPQARQSARKTLGINGNIPIVGIVANLNPWKRHDLLLRAASILAEKGKPVRVVCIGGGNPEPLQALADELGIGKHTMFPGRRTDVPNLLAAFDIGILCSNFESSSNSLIEYLAAGLPVVSTNVGGCPETVEDGVCGYLTTPGDAHSLADAIGKILSGSLNQSSFERGRAKLLDKHSPNAMVTAHVQAYGLTKGCK